MNRSIWMLGALLTAVLLCGGLVACGEEDGGQESVNCRPGTELREGRCVPVGTPQPTGSPNDVGDGTPSGEDTADGDGTPSDSPSDGPDGDSDSDSDGDATPTNPSPTVPPNACGQGQPQTTLTGTVTIPSGELGLPEVTVYVPAGPVTEIDTGAACIPCGQPLSGNPIAVAETDVRGQFVLTGVPEGDNVPLVIEVGKWRREVTVPRVEPCAVNPVPRDLTRLPRNQQEGHIPLFAVTTGGCDALECLLRKIGIDDSEFTLPDGGGRVHLYAGTGGTNRFESFLQGGASFPAANPWWASLDNLTPYDIVVFSCECSTNPDTKPTEARQALQDYTDRGGRVFLSHLHYIWLSAGPSDFLAVADWGSSSGALRDPQPGTIDTSFPKGNQLADWMSFNGAPEYGRFPINEVRGSIRSIDNNLATEWVSLAPPQCTSFLPGFGGGGCPDHLVQYFSFNTPVFNNADDQCGRVVFSDIHVSAGDNSSPSNPFPSGCTTTGLTPQEQALVFMLFDLARCIVPDKL